MIDYFGESDAAAPDLLAISREAHARSGLSIKKILNTLRSATITVGSQQITAPARIGFEAQEILDALSPGQGGH